MLATSKEKHILHYNKNIKKLKVSKPRMGGTRSKLVFIIAYYYDILSLKIFNTSQSYSIKLTTYLFVKC